MPPGPSAACSFSASTIEPALGRERAGGGSACDAPALNKIRVIAYLLLAPAEFRFDISLDGQPRALGDVREVRAVKGHWVVTDELAVDGNGIGYDVAGVLVADVDRSKLFARLETLRMALIPIVDGSENRSFEGGQLSCRVCLLHRGIPYTVESRWAPGNIRIVRLKTYVRKRRPDVRMVAA
jgi:hypothetical protein